MSDKNNIENKFNEFMTDLRLYAHNNNNSVEVVCTITYWFVQGMKETDYVIDEYGIKVTMNTMHAIVNQPHITTLAYNNAIDYAFISKTHIYINNGLVGPYNF